MESLLVIFANNQKTTIILKVVNHCYAYNNCVLEEFLQLVAQFFSKEQFFKLLLLIWKVEGRS